MARDTLAYASSKAIPGLLTLLGVIAFSRILSAEAYGTYALLFSIASVIGTLASSWIAQSILRFGSGHDNQATELGWVASFGLWISIAVASGGFLLFAGVIGRDLVLPSVDRLLVIGLIVATAFYTVIYARLQARIVPRAILAMETCRTSLVLLGGVILLWIVGPYHEVVLVAIVASYPIAVGSVLVVRDVGLSRVLVRSTHVDKAILMKMFQFGWPLSLWTGCILLLSAGDRYLIQYHFGMASVGPYAAAYDLIVRGFALYAFPITLAAHPRIMAAHNSGDHGEARRIWRIAVLNQLLVSIPAVIVIYLAQHLIVIDLLRLDSEALAIVGPLAAGGMIWQLALLIHKPLELGNATKTMLVIAIIVVATSLGLNYVMLPRFGILAAAHVYAASGLMYCGLAALAGWKLSRQAYK